MGKIPFVDVRLTKDNLEGGMKEIFAVIKPEWDLSQPIDLSQPTVHQTLSGGRINTTYLYYPAHLSKQHGVVIKTADPFFVGPIPKLHHTFQFLNDNGLGPPILAFFVNGYCMQFVDGEICCTRFGPRLFQDEIWQPIITRVARWQSREMVEKAREYGLRYLPCYLMPCEAEWEGIMSKTSMAKYKQLLPNLQQLLYEERTLVKEMQQRGAFDTVVCHGDLNASNLIVNVDKKTACLADNDYSGLYHEEYGLASFFCTILDPSNPFDNFQPNTEFEFRVIRHYKEQKRLFDNEQSPPTEREIQEFWHNVQCAKPLTRLMFISTAVFINSRYRGVFPDLLLDTWMDFVSGLWADFHRFKKEVMAARDEFVEDTAEGGDGGEGRVC